MEIKHQKNLTLSGVDIFQVSFTSKQPFDGKAAVNLEIMPKVFYPEGKSDEFHIIIQANVVCKDFYDISIAAVGYFKLEPTISDALKKAFINSNAPAILFPYIRAFISTFTSNLGASVGSVLIPPHFFQGDLEELKDTPNPI